MEGFKISSDIAGVKLVSLLIFRACSRSIHIRTRGNEPTFALKPHPDHFEDTP